MTTSSSSKIHAKQFISLLVLYASILIGWIAYYKYQPRLLDQFGFTEFSFGLIVIQGIILVITPPLAGKLGDRYREKNGHRLPIITAGISFAAMIFMAFAFTLLANPGDIFKWLLPVLIILWLFAMSTFTSPALSTVELFAPEDKLPKAAALITITANLIYSLEPVIEDIIDYLGAPLTFIAGGLAVFVSGYFLKRNSIDLFKLTSDREAEVENKPAKSPLMVILLLGLALGFATGLLLNIFPDLFEDKLSGLFNLSLDGKQLVTAVLVISAFVAIPASYIVRKHGLVSAFWISLVIIMALFCVLVSSDNRPMLIIAAILYAIAFAVLSVSSLPLALARSSFKQKVFCVGIFFAGVEIPNSIMDAVIAYMEI